MLGNWAMGRFSMVIVPTRTNTMEITIATMGRLIKNFDIRSPSGSSHGKRLGVHLHTGAHLLQALSHYAFAGFEPFLNNPLGADALADFDRLNAHFVVAVDDPYLEAALKFRNGPLRDQESALLDSRRPPHFGIPAGAQNISGVGKKPGDPD